MLVCATLFWAGNFIVGKFAFFSNIPPMTLVFFRWLLVWFILLPFTIKKSSTATSKSCKNPRAASKKKT